MPDLAEWLCVSLVLSIGIFVQAAAGFAAGLLIIPTLLWMGQGIPEASTALLIATVPQNLLGLYLFRDAVRARDVWAPGLGRVSFLPIGMFALVLIEQIWPTTWIRQFVGGIVLAVTVATMIYRPTPRPRLHPIWAWIAFPASGFFQGLVGMGGPAMVFWVSAHDWDTRRIRAFLFAMYSCSLIPALVCLFAYFGSRVTEAALQALLSVPLLLLATWLGLKFGDKLGRERLRMVTYGLLLLVGIVGLAAPWIQPSTR